MYAYGSLLIDCKDNFLKANHNSAILPIEVRKLLIDCKDNFLKANHNSEFSTVGVNSLLIDCKDNFLKANHNKNDIMMKAVTTVNRL